MPGICGIVGQPPQQQVFASMLRRLRHADWYHEESRFDEAAGVALGRVALGYVNNEPQPVRCGKTGSLAVMDGEVYGPDKVFVRLARQGSPPGTGQAELLLQGYLSEGPAFFSELDGKFTVAIWDAAKRQFVLANDRLGMKPLYFAHASGRLLFASEIKSLLTLPDVSRAPNRRGIIQFFTFGHLWNNDTMYESIEALGPAQCLAYDLDSDKVQRHSYWSLRDVPPGQLSPAEILDRVDQRLKSQVDAQCKDTEGLGIALSGGLDARTVLALVDHRRVPMKCISLGMEGSLDQRSGRQLAELAGCPFHSYILGEEFKSDFTRHLERMVHLTDGHYLSQCIVMPTLPMYRDLDVRVLLRGHAGELMHMTKAYNFSLDDEGQRLAGADEMEKWLFKNLRAYMLDAVDGPLLTFATEQEAEEVARETLREALAPTDGWTSPLNRISHLFVTQRMRRETAMSLVKFNSVVETRLPYVDADLVQLLFGVPDKMRMHDAIQTHILQRHAPAFMKPANSNTGAAVGASALVKKLSYAKMRVLAKLGVKGYQPYERLGLWLRRELRDQVQALLLDDACLERGTFRPDTVKRVVAQHLENQRNHTFLLLAMMIYELGQRKWSDGQTPATSSQVLSQAATN